MWAKWFKNNPKFHNFYQKYVYLEEKGIIFPEKLSYFKDYIYELGFLNF